jgi:hypothetical protein
MVNMNGIQELPVEGDKNGETCIIKNMNDNINGGINYVVVFK